MGLAQMANMTDIYLLSVFTYQECVFLNKKLEERFTSYMMLIYFFLVFVTLMGVRYERQFLP